MRRFIALVGLVTVGALAAFAALSPSTSSAALPFHGIGFSKGCSSPVVVGDPYTCSYLTISNIIIDTAGDTLTITSIVDTVHAGTGDVSSPNLLPSLSLSFSGGATCNFGQTMCTLPSGSSITTGPFSFYTVAPTDPNPLTDTAKLTWQDTCSSGAGNCPMGDQSASAGSSADVFTPTPSPTNTPTATSTPPADTATPPPTGTPPTQNKDPEGNANNVDLSIPAANLWLCTTGPCAAPGEGDLKVMEHVDNVLTNPATLGMGAYEFQVEYDNNVIASVNPQDIVFSPNYCGTTFGFNYSSTELCVPNGAGIARTPAVCSFSLILENIVRFGCVTSGQVAGPSGSFDIAMLDLQPQADLSNDIFPGNNNGVLTVLKDNGCELADTPGHPVAGSVNGGLLPSCGDLAVTVRILEGDLNLDCRVDAQDEQLIAFRYGSTFGMLLYSKWFDLEPQYHDGDIDIKDLQKVFGRDGSTCQNPIPAQLPLPPPVPFGG